MTFTIVPFFAYNSHLARNVSFCYCIVNGSTTWKYIPQTNAHTQNISKWSFWHWLNVTHLETQEFGVTLSHFLSRNRMYSAIEHRQENNKRKTLRDICANVCYSLTAPLTNIKYTFSEIVQWPYFGTIFLNIDPLNWML